MTAAEQSFVRFKAGVKDDVRQAIIRALASVLSLSPLKHKLEICVVPAPAVKDPITGTCGFGVFVHWKPKRQGVSIFVAAGLAEAAQRDGDSRAEAVEAVVHVFLHEWAHYEQFRDGKQLTERGPELRARGLRRLIERN